MKKSLGYLAILLGIGLFLGVLYFNSRTSQIPRTFSGNVIMTSSWEKYKTQFINSDGRVIDYSQSSLTTSEGQSYCLLRSVWVDNKAEFDLCWKWTSQNLKRPGDNLFGWRWGQRTSGGFGFLDGGGDNSASDADTDIALALILANRRWREQPYLNAANAILPDLWKIDTATTSAGTRYVVAGNWAQNPDRLIINPSYFAPYAWRIFAQVDTKHDWNSLITPAYQLLEKSADPNSGLPPDWIAVNRFNNDLVSPGISQLDNNYSFDAMRIPWRINLDWQWNKEPRAQSFLTSHFQKLSTDYQTTGKLAATYAHDGTVINADESPAMYATAEGYFLLTNPGLAKKMYEDKILKLYSNDTNSFVSTLPYYDQNWLWFGAGLYNQYLIPF
ncbi:glycosyl hydrolase family 8 [Patescibacteria group bacterium]|nr:glycosyl hydrolase family 8 [Patescibacteria group bacterium]